MGAIRRTKAVMALLQRATDDLMAAYAEGDDVLMHQICDEVAAEVTTLSPEEVALVATTLLATLAKLAQAPN
jgi:hypothetical protein